MIVHVVGTGLTVVGRQRCGVGGTVYVDGCLQGERIVVEHVGAVGGLALLSGDKGAGIPVVVRHHATERSVVAVHRLLAASLGVGHDDIEYSSRALSVILRAGVGLHFYRLHR